jgi:hypothetical protein
MNGSCKDEIKKIPKKTIEEKKKVHIDKCLVDESNGPKGKFSCLSSDEC